MIKKSLPMIIVAALVISQAAFAQTQSFWIKGQRYYPLYKVCEEKGIDYAWDSVGRTATLIKNGVEAKIRVGSDRMLIDGKKTRDIGPPLYFHEDTVAIPAAFATRNLNNIFKAKASAAAANYAKKRSRPSARRTIKTIVLDPGHGGKDPGAISRYYKMQEKGINLDMAKRVKSLLAANGMRAYITRDRDKFVTLSGRAEYANSRNADFFVSIHTNSSTSRSLKGFEVYYLSEKTDDSARAKEAARNSSRSHSTTDAIKQDMLFTENRIESRDMARAIIRAARMKGIYTRNNSLRSARFHVLKDAKTDMPGILVELGYISNKKEEALIRTAAYRDKLAEAIVKGIINFKAEYEKNDGFTR